MTRRRGIVFLVVILALLSAASALRAAFHSFRASFCATTPYQLEQQKSTDGSWIAGRYVTEGGCSDGVFRLSLRRADEPPPGPADFLLSPISQHVLFKWLDGSHLLIAARHEDEIPKKPDHFQNVRLSYTLYSDDPDQSRNPETRTVIKRHADFRYQFEKADGVGLPGVRCLLRLTVDDQDENLEQLSLTVEAHKTSRANALRMNGGRWVNEVVPEASFGSITAGVHQNYEKPVKLVTAASFSSLKTASLEDRNFKPLQMAPGRNAPSWQMVWNLDQSQLKSALTEIKSGSVTTKLGFWLENLEIIYTAGAPDNLTEISDFERCISDNAIFVDRQ